MAAILVQPTKVTCVAQMKLSFKLYKENWKMLDSIIIEFTNNNLKHVSLLNEVVLLKVVWND